MPTKLMTKTATTATLPEGFPEFLARLRERFEPTRSAILAARGSSDGLTRPRRPAPSAPQRGTAGEGKGFVGSVPALKVIHNFTFDVESKMPGVRDAADSLAQDKN